MNVGEPTVVELVSQQTYKKNDITIDYKIK